MKSLHNILINCILIAEFIAAISGIIYYKKLKNSYWKWFVWYLVFIFCAEVFSKFVLNDFLILKKYYYNFFVIPIEFLFLYWLYGCKSLANKKLFFIIAIFYAVGLVFNVLFFDVFKSISSVNYILGTLLLMIMIVLEFRQQIKSDKIIYFKENMMFYINFGIILFYISTLPFYAFNKVLYEQSRNLWNNYSTFTLSADIIMYLLFSAAFIWGKPNI